MPTYVLNYTYPQMYVFMCVLGNNKESNSNPFITTNLSDKQLEKMFASV